MYIDPDLVINKNIFKSIESYSVCSICNGIIIKPIQCLECENVFCQSCIDEWKKKTGENSCPFRCHNPTFKNSRTIKNILENLKFKCKNGCKTEISYIDLEEHYQEKCPNTKIDFREKYYKYKKKYEELLKKYNDLENKIHNKKINGNIGINNQNLVRSNIFKTKYHIHCLYDKTDHDTDWICDICKNEYNKKTEGRFRCQNCDFDICLKCRILEESEYKFSNIFLSKFHIHLLKDSTFLENDWICNVCKQNFKQKTIKRYRCEKCHFDICNDCKINEELTSGLDNLSIH